MKETSNPIRAVETIEIVGKRKTDYPSLNKPDLYTLNKRFDKRFQTLRQKVIKILKEDDYARKKDWWLTLRLWAMSGHIKIIVPLDKLLEINAPESISRIRRSLIKEAKLGNKDLRFLLKDEKVLNDRDVKAEESREVWAYKRDLNINSVIAGDLK